MFRPITPVRAIKARADAALGSISRELDGLYSSIGRPSIAPERLLKGQLLIALYSVRSDRALCEQLNYNLLYRWFLDLSLDEPGLDQSNFSRLRERLVDTDVAHRFFNTVLAQARTAGLLSTEHFTVDGTLIEALASLKKSEAQGPGRWSIGRWRRHARLEGRAAYQRHAREHNGSTGQAHAQSNGQPAKLSYGAHVLMDNRHGLCAALALTDATEAEHRVADRLLGQARKRR